MKILKDEQDLLILRESNTGAFIVGTIFFLVGFISIFQDLVLLGILIALFGVLIIVTTKTVTISLDKSTNKLSFLRKGLIGQSHQEYALDQIKEIEMSRNYSFSETKNVGRYSYRLAFVLKNGEVVFFNSRDTSPFITPQRRTGSKVANFLGVPFREEGIPTFRKAPSTVSTFPKNRQEAESDNERGTWWRTE
jgi:hypothetical protein